ncbi:uncharacterized protein [Apostichopus japonicus]|uniref:uncharacterized protein n=1 Tax=Stichopus japonicus TaxID=307972 RepID=UPI003AB4E9DF
MEEDTKKVRETQTSLSVRREFEEGSVTSADEVLIHTGENIKKDEGDSRSMRAESMIGKDGGTLDIQNTGVSLKIPPGALRREYLIRMRIISHHYLDEPELSFASNSSVVVELLPNNVKLLIPATLKLPHCLVLKKKCGWKAKVYSSHHKEGTQPQWEEEINTQCDVTDKTCVMQLFNFSWRKIKLCDDIVEAKRIMLYAAMRPSIENEIFLDIGYYWDLPSCRDFPKLNPAIVLHRIPDVFYSDGQLPLKVLFEKLVPTNWTYDEENNTKEISFGTVAITNGSFCTFVLKKGVSGKTDGCACYFKAGQESKLVELQFSLKESSLSRAEATILSTGNGTADSQEELPPAISQTKVRKRLHQESSLSRAEATILSTENGTADSQEELPPAISQTKVLKRLHQESSQSRTEATLPSMGFATAGDTHEELPSTIAQTKDSDVSEESLQDLSAKIGKFWRDVGRNLEVSEEQLCNIEQMSNPTLKEKNYQMLLVWKMKMASAATYDVLGEALRKAERVDLQQYLLKNYQPT